MEKNYNPQAIEEKWYREWIARGLFHSEAERGGHPYCILIPPPNVTGILHMGHALNNTIQDILIRWHRMRGENAVWMPGTDHAGIATQNVVEQALLKEDKTRHDLGRTAFVERVWEWRKEYGGTIISQLKRLGSSCDWDRERFTMDEGLSRAVTEVFVRLFEKGLIYRANYIINWCPRCQTALSDEESEHAETDGKLYYIRYPVEAPGTRKSAAKPRKKNGRSSRPKEYLVVATTRPETLLGDVAIAVHPEDERYKDLEGKKILLPIIGRELSVIRDDFVDTEFGTGLVKVTPAHDPNDFEMGRRHGLTPINIMRDDGVMNEEAGPYDGLDRFECRKQILKDLQAAGLLEKIDNHRHAVGHCYRCDAVVEPRLSLQWFVKMKPLAEPAIEVVKKGDVQFVPARWTKVYLEWMENIRDWCISRQIWWGHRIPVFYCDACEHVWAARTTPERCPKCDAGKIRQDEDVLDTWFSSWLWPFSTFGWPEKNKDLDFYYPSNDLVTASEIIFFWVARMIMAGLEFMGDIPFRKVYIHGTVRDDQGRKMSKSLGNSIDPVTIIEKFSADALRFSLIMLTATGQDVYVSEEKFEVGRNFGTKIWNAARFLNMHTEKHPDIDLRALAANGEPPEFDASLLSPDDCHILDRLQEAIRNCSANLKRYRFNDAAANLYEFVWHHFCDWYVEYSKQTLYGDDANRRREVLRVMHYVFASSLRLVHPFMPFVTEELWHTMGYGKPEDSIMVAPWPEAAPDEVLEGWGVDAESVEYVDQKHDLIRAGRTLRSDYDIAPSREIDYRVRPHSEEAAKRLGDDRDSIKALLRAASIETDLSFTPPKATPSSVTKLGTIYMPLEGLIDVEAEKNRLGEQLEKILKDLERTNGKLENVDFVEKAPRAVVEKQRGRKSELLEKSEKIRGLIQTLSDE